MAVRETLELDIRSSLTAIGSLDRQLSQASAKFKTGIAEATAQLSKGLPAVNGKVQLEGAEKAKTELTGLEGAVDRTNRRFSEGKGTLFEYNRVLSQAAIGATAAGAALTGVFAFGLKSAADIQTALAPIGTLLGANSKEAQALGDALRGVLASSPQSAEELGLSAYTILSAGITGTSNVLGTLRASQRLSEAGLGTLAEATGIVTSAVNSFSKEGLSANKAAQLFFGTIAAGKTTTQDLAQGFGQIGPLAAATGVRFRELLASTAALTATGQTASLAYTGLRGVLTSVLQPSTEAADAAKTLGIDFSQARLQAVGLAKFLGEVNDAAGGNVQTLSTLFGSVEGLNAVLSLTGPQAKAFAANLEGIDKAGRNLNARAEEISNTFNNRLKTALNQARVAAETSLGPLLDILGTAAEGIAAVGTEFSRLPQPVQTGVSAVVGLSGALLTLGGGALFAVSKFQNLKVALQSFGVEGSKAAGVMTRVDAATTILADNMGRLAKVSAGLAIGATSFQAIGESATGTGVGLAGMAVSGALIGSAFGQPAIGAAAGLIVGIGKAAITSGESTAEFATRIRELSTEITTLSAARAADLVIAQSQDKQFSTTGGTATIQSTTNFEKLRKTLRGLAEDSPGNAQKILEGFGRQLNAGEISIRQYLRLKDAVDAGTVAFQKNVKNAKDVADVNNELAAAATGATLSIEAQKVAADLLAAAQRRYVDQLLSGLPTVVGFFDEATKGIEDFNATTAPEQILKNFRDQLEGLGQWRDEVQRLVDGGLTDLAAVVLQKGPIAGAGLVKAFSNASDATLLELNGLAADSRTQLDTMAKNIETIFGPLFFSTFFNIGTQSGAGFAAGVRASAAGAVGAVSELSQQVIDDMVRELQLGSPSKVFMRMGEFTAQGYALGLSAGTERFVTPAGARLALRPVASVRSFAGSGGTPGPTTSTTSINNPTTIVVQAPMPNPAAVGLETARVLRREQFLKGR